MKSFRILLTLVIVLTASPVNAFLHHGGSSTSTGQSVLNLTTNDQPYMNYFKQSNPLNSATASYAFPGILSADGYPASAPSASLSFGTFLPDYPQAPASGTGSHYTLAMNGTGALDIHLWTSLIVYSGGTSLGLGGATGTIQNPSTFVASGASSVATAAEVAFGAQITAISNNGSGGVRLTISGINVLNSGQTIIIQGLTSTFAYANGVWTTTTFTNTTVDLVGSTVAATGSTGGGELIVPVLGGVFGAFPTTGTYGSGSTQMNSLVICETGDYAAILAGNQIRPSYITQVANINPRYIRFMQMSDAIGSLSTNYTYRAHSTNFTYQGNTYVSAYWGGTATNTADAFTVSNPTASPASGAYTDGEVVQFFVNSANTTSVPTLQLGSRPVAKLYDSFATPEIITFSGTPISGHVIAITFTGSYFSGGHYTYSYTVTSGDASGGSNTLMKSVQNGLAADATLSAANYNFQSSNINSVLWIGYNVNAGSGTTFSYTVTGSGSPEVLTFGTVGIGALAQNTTVHAAYSKVMGGFLTGGAPILGISLEVISEFANRANVGAWYNVPYLYSTASAQSFGAQAASTTNSNIPVVFEISNEVWNNGAGNSKYLSLNLGLSLGFPNTQYYEAFQGLVQRWLMPSFQTGWTGTRSRSQMVGVYPIQLYYGTFSGLANQGFNGASLVTTNTTYAALGGPGGTSGTNYNTSPNRPLDLSDAVSPANYYVGAAIQDDVNNWAGQSITGYTNILQAGQDFAAGGSGVATAFTLIDNDATGNGTASGENLAETFAREQSLETTLATYDSSRASAGLSHLGAYYYEGQYEAGLGSSFTDIANPTALAAVFTSNGWNTSAYGASNTIVATNVVNAWVAYKGSSVFKSTYTTNLQNVQTAHAGRTAYPSQYEDAGPSLWALYPGDITTTPFQSKSALCTFNSGALC
ncbi:MAG TPA: hypothetical protein VMS08_02780 [Candidatus Saccharimonadia bacterium]|nr:hypothetical protein [Candidatus Saccharimonadia bacterium]